ncbi:MAG TPA: DUF5666 domain-containing protein [Chloroflexota bacterium]|nr:DUF5666 domain-containing protein [Chloroflexota bacterium]
MGRGFWNLKGPAAVLLAAALIVVGLGGGVALGQEQRTVTGPVVENVGGRLTVGANSGPVTVVTGPSTVYEKEGRGTVDELQPGQLVGVTSAPTPDGPYAVQVRIFPAALSTVSQGQAPMGGADAGRTMTNARVQSVGDGRLTLSLADQTVEFWTSPDTVVLLPQPATAADVTDGVRVAATGTMGADGSLTASTINVLGPTPQLLQPLAPPSR